MGCCLIYLKGGTGQACLAVAVLEQILVAIRMQFHFVVLGWCYRMIQGGLDRLFFGIFL